MEKDILDRLSSYNCNKLADRLRRGHLVSIGGPVHHPCCMSKEMGQRIYSVLLGEGSVTEHLGFEGPWKQEGIVFFHRVSFLSLR